MSFGSSRLAAALAPALLCWALLPAGTAWGQPSNAPAATQRAAVAASPAQAPPERDALKQLEDELSQALRSLTSKGGAPAPALAPEYHPPVIIIPSQRARDEQERRKDWIFSGQDALGGISPADDWAGTKDSSSSDVANKQNPLNAFYDNLNRQRSGSLMPPPDSGSPGSFQSRINKQNTDSEDENLPKGVKDAAAKLRQWLGTSANDSSTSSSLDSASPLDLFGTSTPQLTPDQIKAHKAYMDEYRKVLDDSLIATPTALDPLGLAGSAAPAAPATPSGLDTLPAVSLPSTQTPTPGTVTRVAGPGVLPDANATVLNQWNPLYAAPVVTPRQQEPMSVPQMVVPRRRF